MGFERPANRLASMQRHFGWFNFWLLGEEVEHPVDAGQYQRWRAMKAPDDTQESVRSSARRRKRSL